LVNSLKAKQIAANTLGANTWTLVQKNFVDFLENIFGFPPPAAAEQRRLDGVLQLLMDMRQSAKAKKDFVSSDKIRNELAVLGVQLKDEKDGTTSYSLS
jgi:cysteinyl-tRNA synthetase